MKKNERLLKLAIRKCRRFSKKTNEWCGYLTPSEIVVLRNAGVKFEENSYGNNHADECIKKGISNPTTVYFYPNSVVMEA